jgi:hypothetical protein
MHQRVILLRQKSCCTGAVRTLSDDHAGNLCVLKLMKLHQLQNLVTDPATGGAAAPTNQPLIKSTASCSMSSTSDPHLQHNKIKFCIQILWRAQALSLSLTHTHTLTQSWAFSISIHLGSFLIFSGNDFEELRRFGRSYFRLENLILDMSIMGAFSFIAQNFCSVSLAAHVSEVAIHQTWF